LRIKDNGRGIPPGILPRIFDAFEQGDTNVTRQFGGLGLGLAICRALIDLHGGSIRAESGGLNRGATFVIELPESVHGSVREPELIPVERAPLHRIRILMAEDHEDTARTLSRLLGQAGFDVCAVCSVAGAIAAMETESFDVLLSDVGLPDGSGCDIMKRLREKGDIPGIAMSGYGMEQDVRRSREAGFSAHLVKPLSVPMLIDALRRAVEAPR
jgi:CheY-like chemotaxis protein